MKAQPLKPMAWSVLTTGPYAEMLNESHLPEEDSDGVFVFPAPLKDGAIPYIALEDLAHYEIWLFDNPLESKGLNLKVTTEHVDFAQLAVTFMAVTGKPARYEDIPMEQTFTKPALWDPDHKLGSRYEGEDDTTLMTVFENFSAFWRIVQQSVGSGSVLRRDYDLLMASYRAESSRSGNGWREQSITVNISRC